MGHGNPPLPSRHSRREHAGAPESLGSITPFSGFSLNCCARLDHSHEHDEQRVSGRCVAARPRGALVCPHLCRAHFPAIEKLMTVATYERTIFGRTSTMSSHVQK